MSSISEARALDRAEPVYLLEIALSGTDAPVLYLAERDLVAGGNRYESYLSGVRNLGWHLGPSEPAGSNVGFVFMILNEQWREYKRLIEVGEDFPFEGASVSLKETYIAPDREPAPPEILFAGVLEGAAVIDLMEFHVSARGLWPPARMA